ncbi:hypothetical protein HDU97_008323 [Phlyctochytrium planicorne]|nr:hypothetical protein HDU97_008323 [Phlyctochytrium planicorne]
MLPIIAILSMAAAATAIPLSSSAAGAAAIPSLYVPDGGFTTVAEPNVAPSGFAPASQSECPVGQAGVGIAKNFIAQKVAGKVENLEVTSVVTDDTTGVTHVHLIETRNGIKISNLVSNVNIDKYGTIISAGYPTISTGSIKAPTVFSRAVAATPEQAVASAARTLGYIVDGGKLKVVGGKVVAPGFGNSDIPYTEEYYLLPSGSVVKVWALVVDQGDIWGNVYVDIVSGKVVGSTNWISENFIPSPQDLKVIEPVVLNSFDEDEIVFDDEDEDEDFDDEDGSVEDTGPKTSKTSKSRSHSVRKTRTRKTRTKKTRTRKTRTKKTKTTSATPTSTVEPPVTTFVPTSTATTTSSTVEPPLPTSTTFTVVVPTTSSTTTTEAPPVPTTTTTPTVVVPPSTTSTTTEVPPVPSTTSTNTVVVPTTTSILPTTTTVVVPTTTSVPLAAPTFLAVPLNEESILSGGQKIIVNPSLADGSPIGWADIDAGEYRTTGNNVNAQRIGVFGKSRNGGNFDYVYDPTKEPGVAENPAAAVANVFYVTNAYHDVLYRYGFDEKSANFQKDNFGRGGKGLDQVEARVQSPDGTNNANFGTPPDGGPGRMNMYIFTTSTPNRDGDVDNTVVIHELTHGLSNRLTGGTGNANCLGTTQSRGMGEGWSDTVAWWASGKAEFTRANDRAVGIYVVNNPKGIRRFPYSTSTENNKNFYSSLQALTRVHDIGEVWSTMLFEVYWNMVDKAGFNPDLADATSEKGSTRFMKNFVDSLKLQPCNPTFLSARDAFIQADKINNGGKFVCDIWRGFAKRGLGVNAANNVDNFELGDGCV